MQDIKKIAVLIDGNNLESKLIEQIINEAGKYGRLTVKRIYGDWSKPTMKEWIDRCGSYAVRPVQNCNADQNGTATDLIIDAMDLLRSHLVDGFCIVSSNSDYAGLANRIREEGLFIMGLGLGNTPKAFVKACETFVFVENSTTADETTAERKTEKAPEYIAGDMPKLPGVKVVGQIDLNLVAPSKKPSAKPSAKQNENHLVDEAYDLAINETTGMAALSLFNDTLRQTDPTFDYRALGFSSFRKFCESLAPKYTIALHDDGLTMSLKRNN
ncbi:MAG: NYN domain-containing protein [Prevotellaceae bacterium]|nr:NYN domain-containing protein [Prevotellaceae bacterium]